MLYLALTILASVAFGLGLKASEARGRDRLVVALANYVFGFLYALAWWLSPWCAAPGALGGTTLLVGVIGGITWVAGLLTMMASIRLAGLALTTAISRLSLMVVVLACVVIWGETLLAREWEGIALALVAVLLMGGRATRGEGRIRTAGVVLLALLLVSQAGAQISNKLFERYGPQVQVEAFMMVLFATATVITGVTLAMRGGRPRRGDILFGAAIGLPNLLTGIFLTRALFIMQDDSLVYTASNVATIALLALAGRLVWREKLGVWGTTGLVLTLISLILLRPA